jgi:site-specific recombinase XerD
MTLIYRTCQRPEDLLKAGISNIKKVEHVGREVRLLRVGQGKTGKTVDIVLAGDLENLVDEHPAAKTVWPTFVHTRAGKRYTYSGIAAMFRRYVKKTGLTDFGLYDIKGKGATDVYRAGVSLERVQRLLGHDSVTTTEIYIKARARRGDAEHAGDARLSDLGGNAVGVASRGNSAHRRSFVRS